MHQDVIKQLSEIELYLIQYGLTLSLYEKIPPMSHFVSSSAQRYAVSSDVVHVDHRKKTVFDIPRELAGRVLGKGGAVLKDLQQRFGCKICLEPFDKTDSGPSRKVSVWHDDDAVHEAVKKCVRVIISDSADSNAAVIIANPSRVPFAFQPPPCSEGDMDPNDITESRTTMKSELNKHDEFLICSNNGK